MKRYDVFAVTDENGVEAVVVVQGNLYLELPSILVIPLYSTAYAVPIKYINPIFEINGQTLILKTEEMTSAPRYMLDTKVGDLEDQAFAVQTALDRLFSGY